MQINQAEYNNLDDYLFEHRNKNYGAYIIRKIYGKHLFLALVIASILFVVFFLFFLISNPPIEDYTDVDYRTTNYSSTEIIIPKLKFDIPTASKPSSNRNIEELPPIPTDELDLPVNKQISKNTEKSIVGNISTTIGESISSVSGNSIQSTSQDTIGTEMYSKEIFMKVETNAQFAGGMAAFANFLRQNIILPDYAKQNKVNGIIYVVMIVNTDGTIQDLKLYKGIEQSCNEEVLRVMKLSPNWVPARIEGVPVRQRLILPIKFNDNL